MSTVMCLNIQSDTLKEKHKYTRMIGGDMKTFMFVDTNFNSKCRGTLAQKHCSDV